MSNTSSRRASLRSMFGTSKESSRKGSKTPSKKNLVDIFEKDGASGNSPLGNEPSPITSPSSTDQNNASRHRKTSLIRRLTSKFETKVEQNERPKTLKTKRSFFTTKRKEKMEPESKEIERNDSVSPQSGGKFSSIIGMFGGTVKKKNSKIEKGSSTVKTTKMRRSVSPLSRWLGNSKSPPKDSKVPPIEPNKPANSIPASSSELKDDSIAKNDETKSTVNEPRTQNVKVEKDIDAHEQKIIQPHEDKGETGHVKEETTKVKETLSLEKASSIPGNEDPPQQKPTETESNDQIVKDNMPLSKSHEKISETKVSLEHPESVMPVADKTTKDSLDNASNLEVKSLENPLSEAITKDNVITNSAEHLNSSSDNSTNNEHSLGKPKSGHSNSNISVRINKIKSSFEQADQFSKNELGKESLRKKSALDKEIKSQTAEQVMNVPVNAEDDGPVVMRDNMPRKSVHLLAQSFSGGNVFLPPKVSKENDVNVRIQKIEKSKDILKSSSTKPSDEKTTPSVVENGESLLKSSSKRIDELVNRFGNKSSRMDKEIKSFSKESQTLSSLPKNLNIASEGQDLKTTTEKAPKPHTRGHSNAFRLIQTFESKNEQSESNERQRSRSSSSEQKSGTSGKLKMEALRRFERQGVSDISGPLHETRSETNEQRKNSTSSIVAKVLAERKRELQQQNVAAIPESVSRKEDDRKNSITSTTTFQSVRSEGNTSRDSPKGNIESVSRRVDELYATFSGRSRAFTSKPSTKIQDPVNIGKTPLDESKAPDIPKEESIVKKKIITPAFLQQFNPQMLRNSPQDLSRTTVFKQPKEISCDDLSKTVQFSRAKEDVPKEMLHLTMGRPKIPKNSRRRATTIGSLPSRPDNPS